MPSQDRTDLTEPILITSPKPETGNRKPQTRNSNRNIYIYRRQTYYTIQAIHTYAESKQNLYLTKFYIYKTRKDEFSEEQTY